MTPKTPNTRKSAPKTLYNTHIKLLCAIVTPCRLYSENFGNIGFEENKGIDKGYIDQKCLYLITAPVNYKTN